jgi:hypothetical protein
MSTLRTYHPIRKVSDKARDKQAARAACIRDVRKRAGYRCEIRVEGVCTGAAEHTHEIVMRSAGGDITDPSNCLATCADCHRHIHNNPEWAYQNGFIKSRYEGRNNHE